LIAQHRSTTPEHAMYRNILDLTHTVAEEVPNWDNEPRTLKTRTTTTYERDGFYTREVTMSEHTATHMDAPAHVIPGTWTVDQIPPERLVRPLVVLDVSDRAANNPDYRISVEDLARWEEQHGTLPQQAVVLAYTGWEPRWKSAEQFRNADVHGTMHFPGYSEEAARFLVDARNIVGIGIDTLSVDPGNSKDYPVHKYCAEHGVYHLEAVANLAQAPAVGSTVVVTPMKLKNGSGAPTRILVLVK